MIDWALVGEIAGGGYGLCILVLVILALVIWIIGLVVKKTTKAKAETKEVPTKES
jgi:Na+-transporting methylmalonyl-CoA/oxaloacetate decarboxylase gamma subunit